MAAALCRASFSARRCFRRGDFSSQDDAAAFAVGLKLLAGAILANKENPLLSSFLPHLYQFVKDLKAGSKTDQ